MHFRVLNEKNVDRTLIDLGVEKHHIDHVFWGVVLDSWMRDREYPVIELNTWRKRVREARESEGMVDAATWFGVGPIKLDKERIYYERTYIL